MLVKTLPVGQLETNCYIVSNENTLECVVIDPGDEANRILDYIEDNKLKCVAILLTHGHFDHVGAVDEVSEETGAPVYMHELDDAKVSYMYMMRYRLPESGIYLKDGDVLNLAGLQFHVMATPGHTLGGVTFRCEDALFTGDTLFKGSCGRVDLPGGDMMTQMDSIKRICQLPGDYEVYPGHMDSSTLERERMFNYYCRLALRN
ncbi:MAG: MBL fold metallo-hydrolase [Oscillospiraceae bacterium]|nr:MBL fold metallo-hydrolase [Oscillospiraceae bacterium]